MHENASSFLLGEGGVRDCQNTDAEYCSPVNVFFSVMMLASPSGAHENAFFLSGGGWGTRGCQNMNVECCSPLSFLGGQEIQDSQNMNAECCSALSIFGGVKGLSKYERGMLLPFDDFRV